MSIEREETLVDEEFSFDPELVRVVSADLDLSVGGAVDD